MGAPETGAKGWQRAGGTATLALAAIAGITLLILVGVVTAGVIARYVFSRPIIGGNEVIQFLSVTVVMLALPHCTASNGHVRADVLDKALGHYGRLFGDVLARVLSVAALAVLAHRAFDHMADSRQFGDVTNMLGLPVWPLYGIVLAGVAISAVVMVVQIVAALANLRSSEP